MTEEKKRNNTERSIMEQRGNCFNLFYFNPRSFCPVCNSRKWQGNTCLVCGYEASRDCSTYRTLSVIPRGTESLEARQKKRRKEQEEKQRAAITRELTKIYDEKLQAEVWKSRELHGKHERLQANHNALQKTYESLQMNYNVLQSECDGLRKECSDRINERKKLREEYRVLKNKYEELQKQSEKMQAERNARISEPVRQKKSFWGQMFGTETQDTAQLEQIRKQLEYGVKEITFGRYPQSEGGMVSPIQWQVLEYSDRGTLVISKYILDIKAYNKEKKYEVAWENSDLRRWLANEFRQQAFDEKELGCIRTVKNANNVAGKDSGERDTADQIFLLSRQETEKYLPTDDARMCNGTPYAIKAGSLRVSDKYTWWLRSMGASCGFAMYVDNGHVRTYGKDVRYKTVGVRPALWLNL